MKSDEKKTAELMTHFKRVCQKAGIKLTFQRMEIFRHVAQSLEHPDAETVYRSVSQKIPTISLDTVYRTLWLLKDLGLVNTVTTSRERARFDANLTRHHHFICRQCGATIDFFNEALDKVRIPEYVAGLGRVENLQIQVQGICLECAGENAAQPVGA